MLILQSPAQFNSHNEDILIAFNQLKTAFRYSESALIEYETLNEMK